MVVEEANTTPLPLAGSGLKEVGGDAAQGQGEEREERGERERPGKGVAERKGREEEGMTPYVWLLLHPYLILDSPSDLQPLPR